MAFVLVLATCLQDVESWVRELDDDAIERRDGVAGARVRAGKLRSNVARVRVTGAVP